MTFGFFLRKSTTDHLILAFLIDKIAALLRNDSITDITERRELYQALFSFLHALGSDPFLGEILVEQRPEKLRSPGIKELGVGMPQNIAQFAINRSPDSLSTPLFKCKLSCNF